MGNQNSNQKITVVGKAIDMKAGAVVFIEEEEIYFIDGLPYWGPQFVGEQVEVSGVLIKKNKVPRVEVDSSGARSQGSTEKSERHLQLVITDANWKLKE